MALTKGRWRGVIIIATRGAKIDGNMLKSEWTRMKETEGEREQDRERQLFIRDAARESLSRLIYSSVQSGEQAELQPSPIRREKSA